MVGGQNDGLCCTSISGISYHDRQREGSCIVTSDHWLHSEGVVLRGHLKKHPCPHKVQPKSGIWSSLFLYTVKHSLYSFKPHQLWLFTSKGFVGVNPFISAWLLIKNSTSSPATHTMPISLEKELLLPEIPFKLALSGSKRSMTPQEYKMFFKSKWFWILNLKQQKIYTFT